MATFLEYGQICGEARKPQVNFDPLGHASRGLNVADAEGGWVFLGPHPSVWISDRTTKHGCHPKDHCKHFSILLTISFALGDFPGASMSLHF